MKKLPPLQVEKLEKEVLEFWQKNDIFAKSLEKTKNGQSYTFYDGPPFANGLPHYGHILANAIKDSVTRYKTMRGYHVKRRLGWDTHGLPVEYEVEKQLGISGKPQIVQLGIDKFNQACRGSVFKYRKQWEDLLTRLGRWADQKNAYTTLDSDYIESVWWVLARVHEKGLLYRGFRSMPYCMRCGTPLSNFEVNQAYHEGVKDPSLYVKFELEEEPGIYFLAWTTTPWSLPGNEALALDAKTDYVKVRAKDEDGEQVLILAKSRLEVLDAEYEIVASFKGEKLAGKRYKPVYSYPKIEPKDKAKVYQTRLADFVSLVDGTGIVHVAPSFGEDDLNLAKEYGLPVWLTVDEEGRMNDKTEFAGEYIKDADKKIIADLTKRGLVFAAEEIEHTYPFCWRCDSPLIYYAVSSWNIAVSKLKKQLVQNNERINWVPDHIKEGRFGNWLADARDWGISRNRFWGAPLPIWVNDRDPDDYIVVSSIEQLAELSGEKVPKDLHRPQIDDIVIEKDGKTYHRTPEVFDCWFESGSMPYAQDHYPFDAKAEFEKNFPADFIAEGLDQTRGWFYTLHVLAAIIFDKPAFKNVVVNGLILAADGKKLSKRLRNYPEPADILSRLGADSLRFFLLSSPATQAEDVRFSYDHVSTIMRNLFMTLYNSASFFSLYAQVDNFLPKSLDQPKNLKNILDRWMVERVNMAIVEVTKGADDYELQRATRPIIDLVDDLSNWYIRRSRRRFWKSENDVDKLHAYQTLHWSLVNSCVLLAPWSPFMSEFLYRQLTQGIKDAPESVHLADWPKARSADLEILEQMKVSRHIVTEGLAKRAQASVKVRQPLKEAKIRVNKTLPAELTGIIKDELNVKSIEQKTSPTIGITLNTNITQKLKREGVARDVIRQIQSVRKEIGLEVDDKINVFLDSDNKEILAAIRQFQDLIAKEVLAKKMRLGDKLSGEATKVVIIEKQKLAITINK